VSWACRRARISGPEISDAKTEIIAITTSISMSVKSRQDLFMIFPFVNKVNNFSKMDFYFASAHQPPQPFTAAECQTGAARIQ
jgi:hypothetical protein